MGASKVVFVEPNCGWPPSSSLHFDVKHPLHSYQPALTFTARFEKRGVFFKWSKDRRKVVQRVVCRSGAHKWPSSELLLEKQPGVVAPEEERADSETPTGQEQKANEGIAAEWLGQPFLHQELSAIIASHHNGQHGPKHCKTGVEVSKKQASGTEKATGLASFQKEKKLSKEKGLLGFDRVNGKASATNHVAALQLTRSEYEPPQNGSANIKAAGKPQQYNRKGGTRIIRRKRKDDAQRFQEFLGRKAPVVGLPPSEHVPLKAMTFPTNTASKAPTSKVKKLGAQPGATSKSSASRTDSATPLVEAPLRDPPVQSRGDAPAADVAVHPREELSRKITSFTARLFKAVAASESTQEIWPRFKDTKSRKAPQPKPPSSLAEDSNEASGNSPEECFATEWQARGAETEDKEVTLGVSLTAEGTPRSSEEPPLQTSDVDVSSSEDKRDPTGKAVPRFVPGLEDRVCGEGEADSARSAEPHFPHWLAQPTSEGALLADAEISAGEVDSRPEGIGHLGESHEEREGPSARYRAGGHGAYRPVPPHNPPTGPRSALGDHSAVSRGGSMAIDLRASADGLRGSLLDLSSSPLSINTSQEPPVPSQQEVIVNPLCQHQPRLEAGTLEEQSGSLTSTTRRRRRRSKFPNLLRWMKEDPEVKPEAPPTLQLKYPERPTFAEIVAGDKRALGSAVAYGRWWVRAWRVPLQNEYDPAAVGDYFGRRPHLVLSRLLQIGSAALSAGLPSLLDLAKVPTAADASDSSLERERRRRAAHRLKSELVSLGPTFIKAAQSMSSRADIVGEETAAVLSELQDRLPPFSTSAAMAVIRRELGRPVSQVFAELSDAPVAAASFGQVYKGRTQAGEAVAVKVQRPDVLRSVALDIHILRSILQGVRKIAHVNSDLRLLADELGHGLYGELDYRAEAANAELFAALQQHLPYVAVPRVLHDHTSRRVLTMEWIEGDRPIDLLAAAEAQSGGQGPSGSRTKLMSLVSMGIESSLVQLLETGIMHSDPHPGNLLLRADGKLVYLDFGLMTRIAPLHRGAMLSAIAHLVNAEWAALTDDLDALDVLKPTTDRREIAAALAEAFGGGAEPLITGAGVPRVRFGQVAAKLWGLALRFRFKLPPYFTLVLRNLASLEGIGLSAEPSFKVFASAYPHVLRRVLTENTPVTRRVLRTLITDGKGSLRWDRLATMVAMHTKGTTRAGSSSDAPAPVALSSRATGVALGRNGAGIRRVLLETDLVRFARDFSSPAAAPVRLLLAAAAADALDRTLFGPSRRRNRQPSQNPKILVRSVGVEGPTLEVASLASSPVIPPDQVVLVADDSTTPADDAADFVGQTPAKRRSPNEIAPELNMWVVRKRLWLLLKLIAARPPKELTAKLRVLKTALLFVVAVMRGVMARAWRRMLTALQGLGTNRHPLRGQIAS